MYRKAVLLLVAAVVATSISAQQNYQAPEVFKPYSELGFRLGPGVSIMYNQRPMQNPRNGAKPVLQSFSAGLTYQYNFTPMWAIVSELNYERKGDVLYNSTDIIRSDAGNIYRTTSSVDRINYVTVPVMARFTIGSAIRFFANAGAYAGFRASSQRIESTSTFINTGDITTSTNRTLRNTTPSTNVMDGGFVVGAGFVIPFAKVARFSFEIRDNVGLAAVGKTGDNFPVKTFNNNASFLFGLAVNLNKATARPANLNNIEVPEN